MNPGFSERTFEFCYNAEFCQQHHALLVTHPHIPSQNQERDLGYDVEFRIMQGHFMRSLFLQHKVAFHAENRMWNNETFYDAHSGPYFRFALDNDQHNTLFRLARRRGNAYYCSPCFHARHELENHFRNDSIMNGSVLINPLDAGQITANERHNITYDPSGRVAMHSELRRFKAFRSREGDLPPLKERRVDREYVEELADELLRTTGESKYERLLSPQIVLNRPIQQAQYILGHIYDVSWFVLP